jgi:sulfofructose kinase
MPGTENPAREVRPAQAGAPRILCAGIIVLDEVFYVESLPPPDGKVEAKEFFIVNGGCAANAAVTVARLGGRATLAGPMGSDANGDFVLAALAREKVDCAACQRIGDGAVGDLHRRARQPHHRDPPRRAGRLRRPVRPRSACRRRRHRAGRQPVSHVRRSDLRGRAAARPAHRARCRQAHGGGRSIVAHRHPRGLFLGVPHRYRRLRRPGRRTAARRPDSFLAVSNGSNDILFLEGSLLRRVPVFAIRAVDTLGAGDALHGGFALALAEGRGEAAALRFAAAVAGLKCTRLGGSAGLPTRAEVDAFMAQYDREAAGRRGEVDSSPA